MRPITYLAGSAYVAICGIAVAAARLVPAEAGIAVDHAPVAPLPAEGGGTDALSWFHAVKPFCNAVEVETALARSRPPEGVDGAAHEAACLALAGKVDRARQVIRAVPADYRWRAAGIVFEIAHPVADAGDDRSAGPIMAMVVEFWPNHHMALYHAGVAEAALGDRPAARRHLEAFLANYPSEDGWRANARAVLERLR